MPLPTLEQLTTSPVVFSEHFDKAYPPNYFEGKIYAYDSEHFYNWLAQSKIEIHKGTSDAY